MGRMALSLLLFAGVASAAERLYVPTVHVLDTQGGYTAYVLAGGEAGMPRAECEMRLDAWSAEHDFSATVAELAKAGKHASFRTTCERKD